MRSIYFYIRTRPAAGCISSRKTELRNPITADTTHWQYAHYNVTKTLITINTADMAATIMYYTRNNESHSYARISYMNIY